MLTLKRNSFIINYTLYEFFNYIISIIKRNAKSFSLNAIEDVRLRHHDTGVTPNFIIETRMHFRLILSLMSTSAAAAAAIIGL